MRYVIVHEVDAKDEQDALSKLRWNYYMEVEYGKRDKDVKLIGVVCEFEEVIE